MQLQYLPYAGKFLRCKTFANSLLLEFHEMGSKALAHVQFSLIIIIINSIHILTTPINACLLNRKWRALQSVHVFEATTFIKVHGHQTSLKCYLADKNQETSMIRMLWLYSTVVVLLLGMYHVLYRPQSKILISRVIFSRTGSFREISEVFPAQTFPGIRYVMRIIIVCTSKNYKLFARSIIQQWSSKDRAATYYYSSKR